MPGDLEPAAAHGHPGPAGARSSRLDPWVDRYAARTRGMTASQIRALFAVAQPARGRVAGRRHAVRVRAAAPRVAETPPAWCATTAPWRCSTAPGRATRALREQILEVMALEGSGPTPTTSSSPPVASRRSTSSRGSSATPATSCSSRHRRYVDALGVFSSYQCEVVHVAMDDQGLDPEALREASAVPPRPGKRAKLVYTIPSFHNPAGVTQGARAAHEVLEIARRRACWCSRTTRTACSASTPTVPPVRADDTEGWSTWAPSPRRSRRGCGSGGRVAPHAVREKLVLAKEIGDAVPVDFTQLAISAYLATQPGGTRSRCSGTSTGSAVMRCSRARADAGRHAVDRARGGFYVWVTLPTGLDATRCCLVRSPPGRVRPGHRVLRRRAGHGHAAAVLLLPEPARIPEGVRRLAAVVETELELRTRSAHPTPAPSGRWSPSPDLA